MLFIEKTPFRDEMSQPNVTKARTPKPQLRATPIEISTGMQRPSSLKSCVKEKQNFKKTKIAAHKSSIVKKSSKDKIFVSSSLWRNLTITKTPKPQLRATPIEISTEIQQPSSLKSSFEAEREAKKTKVALNNMLNIKKESFKDKTSRSNSHWSNITKPRTPKPQLRATLVEISTDIPQPSLSESSVKDKNAVTMDTLLRIETNPSIKEDSVHDDMSLCTVLKHQATKAEIINYIFGRKNVPEPSSSKSPVEEKKAPKKAMFVVEKTSSDDETSPSKFPRLDANKAKIIDYIFRPKNMSLPSKSFVKDMETTKV